LLIFIRFLGTEHNRVSRAAYKLARRNKTKQAREIVASTRTSGELSACPSTKPFSGNLSLFTGDREVDGCDFAQRALLALGNDC
jgi:hypothetical protein